MSDRPWKLDQFRDLVRHAHGDEALALANPSLNSIPWKFQIARYHARESRRLLESHCGRSGEHEIVEAVGGVLRRAAGIEDSSGFEQTCFAIEANVMAYGLALHSVGDLLAKSIFFGLRLDRDAQITKVGLYHVRDQLKMRQEWAGSGIAVQLFLESEEFKYLSAFANTVKHHRLIDMGYHIELEPWESARHGLHIRSFEYRNGKSLETWPEKWTQHFTGADLEAISRLVGCVGRTVNEELAMVAEAVTQVQQNGSSSQRKNYA